MSNNYNTTVNGVAVNVATPNENYPECIWLSISTRDQHAARIIAEQYGKVTESDEDILGRLTFAVTIEG